MSSPPPAPLAPPFNGIYVPVTSKSVFLAHRSLLDSGLVSQLLRYLKGISNMTDIEVTTWASPLPQT